MALEGGRAYGLNPYIYLEYKNYLRTHGAKLADNGRMFTEASLARVQAILEQSRADFQKATGYTVEEFMQQADKDIKTAEAFHALLTGEKVGNDADFEDLSKIESSVISSYSEEAWQQINGESAKTRSLIETLSLVLKKDVNMTTLKNLADAYNQQLDFGQKNYSDEIWKTITSQALAEQLEKSLTSGPQSFYNSADLVTAVGEAINANVSSLGKNLNNTISAYTEALSLYNSKVSAYLADPSDSNYGYLQGAKNKLQGALTAIKRNFGTTAEHISAAFEPLIYEAAYQRISSAVREATGTQSTAIKGDSLLNLGTSVEGAAGNFFQHSAEGLSNASVVQAKRLIDSLSKDLVEKTADVTAQVDVNGLYSFKESIETRRSYNNSIDVYGGNGKNDNLARWIAYYNTFGGNAGGAEFQQAFTSEFFLNYLWFHSSPSARSLVRKNAGRYTEIGRGNVAGSISEGPMDGFKINLIAAMFSSFRQNLMQINGYVVPAPLIVEEVYNAMVTGNRQMLAASATVNAASLANIANLLPTVQKHKSTSMRSVAISKAAISRSLGIERDIYYYTRISVSMQPVLTQSYRQLLSRYTVG